MPAQSADLRWRSTLAVGVALVVATFVQDAGAAASNALCLGTPTTIEGTPGDDLIQGTPSDDVASAFAGNDTVSGARGDDRLCGGRDRDVLFDGAGIDLIDGGDGIDVLYLCPDGSWDRWRNVERVVSSTRACT
ncbi:MAG: calcium-binding protein [Actinomycetota bacterium]